MAATGTGPTGGLGIVAKPRVEVTPSPVHDPRDDEGARQDGGEQRLDRRSHDRQSRRCDEIGRHEEQHDVRHAMADRDADDRPRSLEHPSVQQADREDEHDVDVALVAQVEHREDRADIHPVPAAEEWASSRLHDTSEHEFLGESRSEPDAQRRDRAGGGPRWRAQGFGSQDRELDESEGNRYRDHSKLDRGPVPHQADRLATESGQACRQDPRHRYRNASHDVPESRIQL